MVLTQLACGNCRTTIIFPYGIIIVVDHQNGKAAVIGDKGPEVCATMVGDRTALVTASISATCNRLLRQPRILENRSDLLFDITPPLWQPRIVMSGREK